VGGGCDVETMVVAVAAKAPCCSIGIGAHPHHICMYVCIRYECMYLNVFEI